MLLRLGLGLGATALRGADLPAAPQSGKAEFKLIVAAANTPQASAALQLDAQRSERQTVCFFDTRDGALNANHLILRVRQKGDDPAESTVKIRTDGNESTLSKAEQDIPPEQDWTHESDPTLSRSLDHGPVAKDVLTQVAAGQAPVAGLFNEPQRQLVAARLKDFNWDSLRCYGPLEARVWRQQWKFKGVPGKVTVELWHLQQAGRSLDILEVSTKAKAGSEAQTQALARQFYAAAKASGMGDPAGITKTQMVLDFFKPTMIN